MSSFIRKFFFSLVILAVSASFFGTTFANDILDVLDSRATTQDLNIRGDAKSGVSRTGYLEDLKGTFGGYFFGGNVTGERGAQYLLITIARDAKNLAIFVAVIYLFILVLKLFFSEANEETIKKWRLGIVWTSIGIVIMQISYVFISTLFDRTVDGYTASIFLENIIYPFVRMIEVLASFAFLAMAFFAFFQIITGGGDEEKAKKGKQTIIVALIGFILLKVPRVLVESIYGRAECTERILGICRMTITNPNLSSTVKIMTTFINYINGFIGLVTVLLIIYAGFLVVTGAGDEEKVKKAKSIIVYAVIGIFLLVVSYILFNFFILKG
ncbi:MAG: hypothetical protein Q8K26_02900 [Candidatus Gracilibacteria bacterium]|nr:hypothetical protein [Candidatus Gracilibacteria bacterium]